MSHGGRGGELMPSLPALRGERPGPAKGAGGTLWRSRPARARAICGAPAARRSSHGRERSCSDRDSMGAIEQRRSRRRRQPQSIAPWARSPPALVVPGWLVDLPRRPVLEVRPNARDDDCPGLLVKAIVESQKARGAGITSLAQVPLRVDFAPSPVVEVLGH